MAKLSHVSNLLAQAVAAQRRGDAPRAKKLLAAAIDHTDQINRKPVAQQQQQIQPKQNQPKTIRPKKKD